MPTGFYQSKYFATRFNKSVKQYAALEKDRNFKHRLKPTGNITVSNDVPPRDIATCLTAARKFIDLVHARIRGLQLLVLDAAPAEIWRLFRDTPV